MRNFCKAISKNPVYTAAGSITTNIIFICTATSKDATSETCFYSGENDCNFKGENNPTICNCKKAREKA